jgi:YVTN family beta-propeller protein
MRLIGFALLFGLFFLAANIDDGTVSASERASGLLLVANKGDQTLSIVDPQSGKELAAVPVGGKTGHEVAASPDGRTAWVPIYGDSGVGKPGTDGQMISVIDLESRNRIAQLDLGRPSRPHCPVFGPTNGRLYVTAELMKAIDVIDPTTRKIITSIPTGAPESHMMVISGDGTRAYTANVGVGTVSVIDLEHGKVLTVIPVAKVVQRIAMTRDGRWVFTADQTKAQIAMIDTKDNSVKKWIPVPDLGYGMAPTADGTTLVVAHPGSDSVSIVDLGAMKVEQTIRVPASPQEVLIPPSNSVAYVSCDRSKQIAVIDLSTKKVQRLIDVGAGADGLAWAR